MARQQSEAGSNEPCWSYHENSYLGDLGVHHAHIPYKRDCAQCASTGIHRSCDPRCHSLQLLTKLGTHPGLHAPHHTHCLPPLHVAYPIQHPFAALGEQTTCGAMPTMCSATRPCCARRPEPTPSAVIGCTNLNATLGRFAWVHHLSVTFSASRQHGLMGLLSHCCTRLAAQCGHIRGPGLQFDLLPTTHRVATTAHNSLSHHSCGEPRMRQNVCCDLIVSSLQPLS